MLHELTNLTRNVQASRSPLNDLAQQDRLQTDTNAIDLIATIKETANQLFDFLVLLPDIERIVETDTCNLLDAVSRAARSQNALMDSDIELDTHKDQLGEVKLPKNLVSCVDFNLIDDAQDAIIGAKETAGHLIRIESSENEHSVVCHRVNSGAIDGDAVPHIFEERYSTKGYGRGLTLPLTIECLRIFGAELELTDTGPLETVLTLEFGKTPVII